ncbi:MAG: hypothetical protein ACLFP1_02245 [Candidatus Goldiibacteriota bacterium]
MKKKPAVLIFLICFFAGNAAALQSIQNEYLGINADDQNGYDFAFDMGTSALNTPASGRLLYNYEGAGYIPQGTSKMVVKIDNNPVDVYDTANGQRLGSLENFGSYIRGRKRFLEVIDLEIQWHLAVNPATGTDDDTMKMKFIAENISSADRYFALRLEWDTKVLGHDGTNISVDNGFSVVTNNTVWRKSENNIPANWWDYDVAPPDTPNLVGRGYLKNNPYGEPATEPDMFEVADWNDVNGAAQWTTAEAGLVGEYNDSAVVLWFTDGEGGDETSPGTLIPAGQSITWVAYYGINQEELLTTPTITPTDTSTLTATRTITMTPTFTNTPSFTVTSTITATSSITQTHTASPSVTRTYTATNTPSITPTGTITLTYTATGTNSPTPSITLTQSATDTKTPTVTASITPTYTATPSITITSSATATPTITPTATFSPTLTPTPPDLVLIDKGPFPHPADEETHIIYWLSKDAVVSIKLWTVSGEIVRQENNIQSFKGYNKFYWDTRNRSSKKTASGVYIYRISAAAGNESVQETGKVVVVR